VIISSGQPYVGEAVPYRTIWVSNTTLFHIAARELGNAMYWTVLAKENDLIDPWIDALTEINIAALYDTTDTSGILGA
jgi:hypothetical protein